MTSCDMRHVLPAAGSPMSRMHALVLASPLSRLAYAPCSQLASPPTSLTSRSSEDLTLPLTFISIGTHCLRTSNRWPESAPPARAARDSTDVARCCDHHLSADKCDQQRPARALRLRGRDDDRGRSHRAIVRVRIRKAAGPWHSA
eukprot:5748616-Prymnesium_polylepis.1